VRDVQAESTFYRQLGFEVFDEMGGFIAMSYGDCILFGLQEEPHSNPSGFAKHAIWQIGAEDINVVFKTCQQQGLDIIQEPELQKWDEWIMSVVSPNGYTVLFEGPMP
jgi:predicted enzyme related to lactoylglutathione lyase